MCSIERKCVILHNPLVTNTFWATLENEEMDNFILGMLRARTSTIVIVQPQIQENFYGPMILMDGDVPIRWKFCMEKNTPWRYFCGYALHVWCTHAQDTKKKSVQTSEVTSLCIYMSLLDGSNFGLSTLGHGLERWHQQERSHPLSRRAIL